jgi:AraC-like DNA-binding protein
MPPSVTIDRTLPGVTRTWIEAACRTSSPASGGVESTEGVDGDVEVAWLNDAVREAERIVGSSAFCLRAASLVPADALGMVSFAWAARPTVGAGLASLDRYLRLLSPSVSLRIQADGAWTQLVLVLPDGTPNDASSRCAAEFFFAHLLTRIRSFSEVVVQKVTFRHGPVAHRDAYDPVFRAPVEFGRDQDSITIDAAVLEVKLPPHDCSAGVRVRRGATAALRGLPEAGATSSQVREVILDELIGGIPHMTRVSSRLGMTVPALAAVLKEEGATFAGLREELLYQLTRVYLDDRDLALVDVAFAVGFIDYDVFVRTFARWSGQTPTEYRQA